jgi:cysteine desulfurase
MRAALDAEAANASSVHRAGRAARARIEAARSRVGAACGALARELVFTSGGTEALHLAVRSAVGDGALTAAWVDPGAHPALRAAVEGVARSRGIEVSTLSPDRWGRVDLEGLERALRESEGPALVGLTVVQHETGAIAPLDVLLGLARARGAKVVLDAVQALGKIPLDLGASGAACAALSAHKVGGPSGVGAAWIRHDQRALPLIDGGSQERGVRAGTENLIGIIGFAAALEDLPSRLSSMPSVAALRDELEVHLRAIEGTRVSAQQAPRVGTVAHLWIDDVEGHELVAALDVEGVCASSGPACSSGRGGVSAAARAMFPDEFARGAGALRLSLGPETRPEEIDRAARVIARVIARMRRSV